MPSRSIAAGMLILTLACPAAAQSLKLTIYASGFNRPVSFVQDPADPAVQFVVEQGGRVRVVRKGTLLARDFLDLRGVVSSGGEQGLLGLAFAPDGGLSRRVYVNFTDLNGNTVIARYRRSAGDPLVADLSSRFDLRFSGVTGPAWIAQPFANHNGGHLAFGPDGYLYIGLGDGGSGGDPNHLAQDPTTLLGKMLRIDVSVPDANPLGYSIPPDNPFVDGRPIAARGEIWAFGLRNPWRYAFDDPALGGTGALIIGDVGQGTIEEIDYEPAGAGGRNYGWRNREGAHDYLTSPPPAYLPLTDPVYEYNHTVGQSISAGYVYRGRALGPDFAGRYFFADFVAGRVWSLRFVVGAGGDATATDVREHTAELGGAQVPSNVSGFGLDAAGELYIVSYGRGAILRLTNGRPDAPTNLRIIR